MNFGCIDILKITSSRCAVMLSSQLEGTQTGMGKCLGELSGECLEGNFWWGNVRGFNQWHTEMVRSVRTPPLVTLNQCRPTFFNPNAVAGKSLWCI